MNFLAVPLLILGLLQGITQVEAKSYLIQSYGPAPEGANVIYTYGDKNISVMDCDEFTANNISVLPYVDRVEENSEVIVDPIDPVNSIDEYEYEYHDAFTTLDAPLHPGLWGLDQLDHKIDEKYTPSNDGDGVTVYVIDTGVSLHDQFKKPDGSSRVVGGKAFGVLSETDWEDCNGHGTHVSSTIAGKDFGVAKKVEIVSARVFGCSGGTSYDTIIAAMKWVLEQKKKGPVNMSLGGGVNSIVNGVVADLFKEGFLPVVSAGNSARDACSFSPASADKALTVGCFDVNNKYCYFTNEGSCVDVFAPGMSVWGAKLPDGGRYLSGTSMSAPHVAGVAATIMRDHPKWTVQQVSDEVVRLCVRGTLLLKDKNSPNLSVRIDNGRTSPPVTPHPTLMPTPFPTNFPVPTSPPTDPPKCYKRRKARLCRKIDGCRWYKRVGCRNDDFCGFRKRKQCEGYDHCKWENRKCLNV